MALKWIGSMLVLFSAGGFGIWSAMQWRERLRLLEKLRQMIYFLKGEITYSHAPLAEALERVGKREAGPLGQLFTAAAEGICRQEGESLQEIWRREVQVLSSPKIRLPLTEEDLEQLDISIEYLRTNQREKCRLYTSLGIMGGMFLVIVMY